MNLLMQIHPSSTDKEPLRANFCQPCLLKQNAFCSKATFRLSETKCTSLSGDIYARGWRCFLCRLCTIVHAFILLIRNTARSQRHMHIRHRENYFILGKLNVCDSYLNARLTLCKSGAHHYMQSNYAIISWKKRLNVLTILEDYEWQSPFSCWTVT